MLHTADVLRFIFLNEWFPNLNLKDSYFHIPINKAHHWFLYFAFQGCLYQFRVLPFSLSLAPRVFSTCIQAVLLPLLERGIKILELHVKLENSVFPNQIIQFKGMVLNSQGIMATLSPQCVTDITYVIALIHQGHWIHFRLLLRLHGMLTAATQIVPLGLLELQPLLM